MLRQNHCQIDGFWKVLVKPLFQVGHILALEHIFKIQEGPCVVQISFFHSADEVVDCFVNSKLDSKLAQIIVNFSLSFVERIIALKLVDIT